MAKQVVNQLKIQAPGGQATPAPPIGPALGQAGINPGQFIQQFNAETAELNGKVVGCVITVYNDRSFSIEIKSPPAPVLIKEAAGLDKGAAAPGHDPGSTITREQLQAIAQEKMPDLNAGSMDAACRIIEGTARSMGISVAD